MRRIKVAVASLNLTPLALKENRSKILSAIKKAKDKDASVLALPELTVTSYGCEDYFLSISLVKSAWEILEDIASYSDNLVVGIGHPLVLNSSLFNCYSLLHRGKVIAIFPKIYLPSDGIHYEKRWFKSWNVGESSNYKGIPIGDIVVEIGDIRIGCEICEDSWSPKRKACNYAGSGVDIVFAPAASHFSIGKYKTRENIIREGSRALQAIFLHSNLLGNENGKTIYDGYSLIAAGGEIYSYIPPFSFKEVEIATSTIDIDRLKSKRAFSGSYLPSQHKIFSFKAHLNDSKEAISRSVDSPSNSPEEEFVQSASLALFDYLTKSKSKGFVVSLSGGADSTTSAVLVYTMVRYGFAQLTADSFLQRVGLEAEDEKSTMKKLLTCVYQRTRNNSPETLKAAKEISNAIGATFYLLDIDNIVEDYIKLVEQTIGEKISWENADIALQNVQARSRVPSVWLIANLKNCLLITTSNKSESILGYATMDGDTSGSIAPIAGVRKTFILRWLRWMEKKGPKDIGPIPELKWVNSLTPSAELRPKELKQTDEEDLMPYEILDFIMLRVVSFKETPPEIFREIKERFPQYDDSTIIGWIEKFFSKMSKSQWKRERLAPSFHIEMDNVDPRSFFRFPILSGGFDYFISKMEDK